MFGKDYSGTPGSLILLNKHRFLNYYLSFRDAKPNSVFYIDCTIIVMRCAIWYHLYNLKNVKNTHRGVLFLVKLQAEAKLTLLHECFSRFLNCKNGTKSCNAIHLFFALIWTFLTIIDNRNSISHPDKFPYVKTFC